MKFHQLFILIIVLLFLVIPPFFSPQQNNIETKNYIQDINKFSLFTIVISSLWAFFLFFFSETRERKFTRKSLRISLLTFILIFYISLIFNQAKIFFNFPQEKIIFNLTKTQKILSCLQILVLCIYEEILYRKFLVSKFGILFAVICNKFFNLKQIMVAKISEFFAIFFVAILFSLAHLYSGILNVIFSFLASLIFSICYKYTKNIFSPIVAHFLYNILVFLTLVKI